MGKLADELTTEHWEQSWRDHEGMIRRQAQIDALMAAQRDCDGINARCSERIGIRLARLRQGKGLEDD